MFCSFSFLICCRWVFVVVRAEEWTGGFDHVLTCWNRLPFPRESGSAPPARWARRGRKVSPPIQSALSRDSVRSFSLVSMASNRWSPPRLPQPTFHDSSDDRLSNNPGTCSSWTLKLASSNPGTYWIPSRPLILSVFSLNRPASNPAFGEYPFSFRFLTLREGCVRLVGRLLNENCVVWHLPLLRLPCVLCVRCEFGPGALLDLIQAVLPSIGPLVNQVNRWNWNHKTKTKS